MATVKDKLIRLAYENPELRPQILPLVKRTAAKKKTEGSGKSGVLYRKLDNILDSVKYDAVKMYESGGSNIDTDKVSESKMSKFVDQAKQIQTLVKKLSTQLQKLPKYN